MPPEPDTATPDSDAVVEKLRQITSVSLGEHGDDMRIIGNDDYIAINAAADLLAAQAQLSSDAEKWRSLHANKRGIWPLETRDACDAFEEAHDVSVCSSEHLALWVERLEAAEAQIAELSRERDMAREANGKACAQIGELSDNLTAAFARAQAAETANAELREALTEVHVILRGASLTDNSTVQWNAVRNACDKLAALLPQQPGQGSGE